MGRLFEREYCVVSGLMESPERPCVFVLGGAKIADAFQMMQTVLDGGAADRVLTGGLVANILLAAAGKEIGSASVDFIIRSNYGGFIESSRQLLDRYGDRILLPEDLAGVQDGRRCEHAIGAIPGEFGALDIGTRTAAAYASEILAAKTVFVNGPMGVFEQPETELGTPGLSGTLWATPRPIRSSAAATASQPRPNTAKRTPLTTSAPAAAH